MKLQELLNASHNSFTILINGFVWIVSMILFLMFRISDGTQDTSQSIPFVLKLFHLALSHLGLQHIRLFILWS